MGFAIALIAAAAAAHMLPLPFLFEAFKPSGSLWRVKPAPDAPKAIYITFDDGPNAAWTPALLDALRDHGVRATFFLIDDHITDETAPIVARIAREGHAIGLHSGTRRLMVASPGSLAAYLGRMAARIESITGRKTCPLFRPHAGWRSVTMYMGLSRIGYRLAGWSWGMWDWDWWRGRDADRIASRLARKASPGDIIVMHDGHHVDPRADRRHAVETIRQLAPVLRSRGFAFGTLCTPDEPR